MLVWIVILAAASGGYWYWRSTVISGERRRLEQEREQLLQAQKGADNIAALRRLEAEQEEKRRREALPVLHTKSGKPLFRPLRVTGTNPVLRVDKEERNVRSYQSAMMIAQEFKEKRCSHIAIYARTQEGGEYQFAAVRPEGDWIDIS